MSGIVGSKINIRGSGRIAKLGTDGQVLTSSGAGVSAVYEDLAGGISWQSVETGATFTAVAGNGYPVNTTAQACTVTLPAGSVGDIIELVDYAGTWDTNNVTLTADGSEKIKGSTDDVSLAGKREAVTITYVDATQGWVTTSAANETTPAMTKPYNIDILVVGGGGSGGSDYGGGGGAGGLIYKTSHELTAGTYNVVIGAGAAAATGSDIPGNTGVDTTWTISEGAASFTAKGGGAAGHENEADSCEDGGSGGGAGYSGSGASETQTGQAGDSGTYGFGNDGGDGIIEDQRNPGGGGGAGTAGTNGSNTGSGDGGTGKDMSAVFASEGDSGWFASGGGGGWGVHGTALKGDASAGGGTDGGTPSGGDSSAAAANTGGGSGGGAGGGGDSGAGGSGVICFKVLTVDYSGTTSGSPSTRVVGDYTIVKFTGDGSYTA